MSESDLREGQPGAPPDSPVEKLPTHQAAAGNDVARLSELVEEGSPLEGPESRDTPLHAAAKRGALDTLRWMLDNKTVSPLKKAGNGNTAAHYAAVYGHLEALKLLIDHDPELSSQVVSQVDESGLSLLSLSTLQGDKEMVAWLIDHHPEVGDIPNHNGDLAVHFAAAQGHLSILKLLVRQYGKDIAEKQDKNSTKPVYFASQEGRLTILDYLINELGVDPVAREKSGISSVHAAVQAGRYKAVKWLISKLGHKYILDKTIDGATPLHMAAAQGHTDILRYLLENLESRSDVNVLDHIHATPAHDAAEYGQMESMLLLLKNGADISIKDTESKTPYELAMEQSHPEVAAMIADLRDNGPSTLTKYEKKKRANTQPVSMMQSPRTTHQEAEDLSAAIKQSTHIQEQRRSQQLQRQESLQRMNERGLEEDGKPSPMSDEDEIEHTLGPNGDIYAKPKKRKHRNKRPHQQGSEEDLLKEPTPFTAAKPKNSLLDSVLPLDDSTYASVNNHETTSNYSRPSRVRRYQDSDSEITSISSRYHDGRHNIPGFYPPYGGAGGGYYPPMAPPPRRGHHSSASSLHSSRTGHSRRQGYPQHPMMNYTPYGYYPMPYPAYGYPYPHYGAGYPSKTGEDRMHLAALQQQQGQAAAAAGHMMYYYQPPRGRRSKLKKRTRSRQPSRDPSPPGAPRKHTDADMGYGPAVQNRDDRSVVGGAKGRRGGASDNQSGFHPQAPPITRADKPVDAVVNFDSNFIMMKKSDTAEEIKQLGGTMLITARPPKHYDGRWDSYIMTDSESEHEVDENYCVAFAAETAAILAIGCVSGLKGLKKLRKGQMDGSQQDRAYLSSAWDEPPMPTKGHSRRDSISGVADPTLMDVTPEDFAAMEEMGGQEGWAGGEMKTKKKKNKKGDRGDEGGGLKYRSASAEALDKQPQSELLAGEMERHKNASVSRSFGQKMLFNALGARESSMLDIASTSMAGSLNPSADEAEDDEFNETINMVHGIRTGERSKSSARKTEEHSSLLSEKGTEEGERPKSARKKDKQKAKEEERVRKEREKEGKRQEKINAKREREKKKEDEKRVRQEAREKTSAAAATSGATPSKRPATPKKKSSPPVPTRPAPTPPKSAKSTASAKEVMPTQKSTSSVSESSRPPKKSPPLQRRQNPSSSASSHHGRQRELQQKPTATSTPLSSKESLTPKRNRVEKATLKSSPTQPARSTALSKQTSLEIDRGAKKKTSASPLQTQPPLKENNNTKGATQRKNRYFDGESDEEVGAVSTRSGTKTKPAVEEEVDPGIADLDAVLAQLENIQTGGLMSWLEPNKVTDIDKEGSEDSEDSLPLVVPTRQTNKLPSPPRSRAFGTGLQTVPAGTGLRQDTETPPLFDSTTSHTNVVGSTPLEISGGAAVGRGSRQDGKTLAELTSLPRTKHGSPHPRRRRHAHKEELDSAPTARENDSQTLNLHEQSSDGDGSAGQRSDFEQKVMSTLEALRESMNQLQRNPSITQTEITEQTKLQQQLIQNLVTYSQHDPQLVNKLLSLLTERDGMEASSTDQLEQLQQKILGAHEKTYQETQEHFRTQEALQRAIQRTLEEQTQQQMKGMEANFQMFSKLMEEQLSEQRKKFEEELKKREKEEEEEEEEEEKKKKKRNKDHSKKKDKKKKHRRRSEDSDSGSSRSDEEGMMMMSGRAVDMPAVKTMEAKIFIQDLLKDTVPPKQGKGRVRRTSDVELFRTTEALSRNLPLGDTMEDEEEEEDDDEMYFQHARPVTIRRADIKVQRQDEYTPQRPTRTSSDSIDSSRGQPHRAHMQIAAGSRPPPPDEGHFEDFHILKTRPPKQLDEPEKKPEFDEKNLRYGKQHIEVNERVKPVEDVHPLAGAGGELAAALTLRQRQITSRQNK